MSRYTPSPWPLLVAALALSAPDASSQPGGEASDLGTICAMEGTRESTDRAPNPELLNRRPLGWFPSRGTIYALIVFAQDPPDDEDLCFDKSLRGPDGMPQLLPPELYASTCGLTPGDDERYESWSDDPATEWPATTSGQMTLPSWASGVVDPPGTDPASYTPGSLSHYYWVMSGGQLRFEGVVYPELLVPSQPVAAYAGDPNWLAPPDQLYAVEEFIAHMNANPHGIDFSIFDRYTNGTTVLEPDGEFDALTVAFRNTQGVSSLGGSWVYDFYQDDDQDEDHFPTPQYLGGLRVRDGVRFGSGVIAHGETQKAFLASTTHEWGHRMLSVHTTPGAGGAYGDAFGMMWNAAWGVSPSDGDLDALGWRARTIVRPQEIGERQTFTLEDAYTGGALLCISPSGSCQEPGDLLVGARTNEAYWSGHHFASDGDWLDELYVRQPGLFISKRADLPFWSSMERSGFEARTHRPRQVAEWPDVRYPYQEGDAYTPFSYFGFAIPWGPREDPQGLNERVGISDVEPTGSGWRFDVWRDFPQAAEPRALSTMYTFEESALARRTAYTVGGELELRGENRIDPYPPSASTRITLLPAARLVLGAGSVTRLEGAAEDRAGLFGGETASLVVRGGELYTTDALLSAADPSVGWGGLRLEPGSRADLLRTTVEGVRAWGGAAITALGAALTLEESVVQGSALGTRSSGVYASGSGPAEVRIVGSDVLGHAGDGVVAAAGARVYVEGSVVGPNGGSGVHATNASVYLLENELAGNGAFGASASRFGAVTFGFPGAPTPDRNNVAERNAGGALRASSHARQAAGEADERYARNHLLRTPSTALHVWAQAYSDVAAQCDWWGAPAGPDRRRVNRDATSTFVYEPFLTSASGGCADGPPEPPDTYVTREWEALQAAERGETERAMRLLGALVARGDGRRGRAWAYGLLAGLVRERQPDELAGFLQSRAARPGERLWALLTLAHLHLAAGRPEEARRAAEPVASEGGPSELALLARAALHEADLAVSDLDGAAARVAEAEAGWPEHEVTAALKLAQAVAENEPDPSRLASGANLAASPEATPGQPPRMTGLGLPFPNPASDEAVVVLDLADGARARVEAYDVLGRRVAILADGVFEAGRYPVPIAAGRLPAGLYFVRAEVSGVPAVLQRPFTVVH